jgi:hypothetical protein
MTEDGFLMGFSAYIVPVPLKTEMIPSLLRRVREIYDLDRPPEPMATCKDCALLTNLLAVAST